MKNIVEAGFVQADFLSVISDIRYIEGLLYIFLFKLSVNPTEQEIQMKKYYYP